MGICLYGSNDRYDLGNEVRVSLKLVRMRLKKEMGWRERSPEGCQFSWMAWFWEPPVCALF
jgi:hypothetical protein